jgi:hypothetical protein
MENARKPFPILLNLVVWSFGIMFLAGGLTLISLGLKQDAGSIADPGRFAVVEGVPVAVHLTGQGFRKTGTLHFQIGSAKGCYLTNDPDFNAVQKVLEGGNKVTAWLSRDTNREGEAYLRQLHMDGMVVLDYDRFRADASFGGWVYGGLGALLIFFAVTMLGINLYQNIKRRSP